MKSRKNAIKKHSQIEIDLSDVQDSEKRTRIEHIIEKERLRKKPERYRFKKMSIAWGCLPLLSGFIGIAWILYVVYTQGPFEWYWVIPCLFFAPALVNQSIEEDWELTLKAKQKLHDVDNNFRWYNTESGISYWDDNDPEASWNYHDQYIYSDSRYEQIKYIVCTYLTYFVNALLIIPIAILLYIWLGTISIAPTSIIIILLFILIAQNMERR